MAGTGVVSAGGIYIYAWQKPKNMYDPKTNKIVQIPDPTLSYISIAPLLIFPVIAIIIAPKVPPWFYIARFRRDELNAGGDGKTRSP